MRLKITLSFDKLKLPINYKSCLQGCIYNILDEKNADFFHNEGYKIDKKTFKLFVFSDIFGKYEIKNNKITFFDNAYFFISSANNDFLSSIYKFLSMNDKIILNDQLVTINKLDMQELKPFQGNREVIIETLSPVVAFKTEGEYVNYYKPSDSEFAELCRKNLYDKFRSLGKFNDINFNILDVYYEKKRFVKYKGTFYISYNAKFKISTNYETLLMLYDTGLSAKNSVGFGMIKIVKINNK